ncbi:MAG: hypothetical protein ACM3H7_05500 [Acidobacteriaceae bacterium]
MRIQKDNTNSYTYFSTSSQLKELVQNDAISHTASLVDAGLWERGYSQGRAMSLDQAIGSARQALQRGG